MHPHQVTELPIVAYRIETPDGMKDCLALVPDQDAFARGLAAHAILGTLGRPLQTDEAVTPDVFVQDPAFMSFMHDVIVRHGPRSEGLIAEARRQGNGFLYVIDQRTRDPRGRIPPQDVIGAFEIHGGVVRSSSYRANPNYALLTSDGFLRLTPDLQQCLLVELAGNGDATDSPA